MKERRYEILEEAARNAFSRVYENSDIEPEYDTFFWKMFFLAFGRGVYSAYGSYNFGNKPSKKESAISKREYRWFKKNWKLFVEQQRSNELLEDNDIEKRIRNGDKKWIEWKKKIRSLSAYGFFEGTYWAIDPDNSAQLLREFSEERRKNDLPS